jgi:hypothetical protein
MTSSTKKKEALAKATQSKRALKKDKKIQQSKEAQPKDRESARLEVLEMLKEAARKRNNKS